MAPAAGLAAVAAALSAGADAVYVGVRGFSREGSRAGMGLDEIAAAASLCAEAGARLEAALNAVPAPSEIAPFVTAATRLRDAGAAALILNDPGLIALVRSRVPGIGICASVGLSALNPWDALFLRDLGADAVVLPTAVRCEEVRPIKEAAGLAVEVFLVCRAEAILHGKCGLAGYALSAGAPPERPVLRACGAAPSAKLSGRCHLACRALPIPQEPYSIEEDLARWIRAGVDAFKVEGRGLPPEKLFALVGRLRKRLDAAVAEAKGEDAARP